MGCVSSRNAQANLEGQPLGLCHFEQGRVLGEGGFGQVRAVLKRGEVPETWYALKMLTKQTIVDRRRFHEVFTERDLLTSLQHPRICCLYYAFQDPKHLYLVMDIALGGDLRYQLNHNANNLPFSENRVRIYTAQVVEALSYIHGQNLIHRDLKPENLLLDSKGWIKVTDFGVARFLDDNGNCFSGSGTSGYMAPEIYTKSHKHSKPADFFALGVIIFELLAKRRPFRGEEIRRAGRFLNSKGELRERDVSKGELKEPLFISHENFCGCGNEAISDAAIQLLNDLFHLEQDKRIGATDIGEFKNHAFFQKTYSFDWGKITDGTHQMPFLPDTSRMNAEPDVDIQNVFLGEEQEKKLRHLTAEEQKIFEGYEFDHTKPLEDQRASLKQNIPANAVDAGSARDFSMQKSHSTVVGTSPTNLHSPRAPDRHSTMSVDVEEFTSGSLDEVEDESVSQTNLAGKGSFCSRKSKSTGESFTAGSVSASSSEKSFPSSNHGDGEADEATKSGKSGTDSSGRTLDDEDGSKVSLNEPSAVVAS